MRPASANKRRGVPEGNHPRSAQYGRARKKQFLVCSLQPLTCLQVEVLPRQGMVEPSSDSRLWLGETLVGASSAVNGRACRRRKPPAGTGQPLQPTCRPQHNEKTAASKLLPSQKPVRGVNSEPPSRDRNGEGSDDREMSHQMNLVSRRGRGSGMYGQYDKAKKGR